MPRLWPRTVPVLWDRQDAAVPFRALMKRLTSHGGSVEVSGGMGLGSGGREGF